MRSFRECGAAPLPERTRDDEKPSCGRFLLQGRLAPEQMPYCRVFAPSRRRRRAAFGISSLRPIWMEGMVLVRRFKYLSLTQIKGNVVGADHGL